MANNLSLGPVQVLSDDIASINLALRDLSERIDELKGLRGRALIWDRTQVSSPTADSDAVDRGSLVGRESLFHITLLSAPVGIYVVAPGTTYVEISTLLREQINFATPTSLEARIVVAGWGTETAADKGVALTDDSGVVLAEVEWTGQAEQTRIGTFTSIATTTDTLAQLRAKGGTATESLILYKVGVEFRFDAGSSLSS